ncbi:MAG: O-antigen ligase family protein [Betaproteobacteria bacterium]|nr:O-antigen ligase family protein [Betaproteobacteria bacterium]
MIVLVFSLIASRFLVTRLGVEMFAFTLVGLLAAVLFATASLRNLMVPFIVWVVAVGGFRFLWSVRSPVLPDLYLDRMMMIWLGVIFMIKYVAERRPLRGPFALDLLLLAHGLYIYIRVYIQDSHYLQPWFMSVAIPYFAYFFAKNIVVGDRNVRALWWSMFALVIYYSFTAIVEKYRVDSLVFPRSILAAKELEFRGRSIGPFEQPGVFGTAFATLLPVHLYLIATARSQVTRIIVGGCFLAAMAGLYFTYTRGSWLAGIAGSAVAVYLNWRRFVPIVAPAGIAAAILAIAVLGLREDQFMKERVENDDTLGSRVGTAVTVLRLWRDHPLFGIGFFQFRAVREQYVSPVEAPVLGTIRFSQFRHNPIHDIYLGPLAEDGLVGALMQFGIYFLIFRKAFAVYRNRGPDDHFGQFVLPVCAGAFAAYLVGGLAFDYRYFSFNGTLFYMIAGVLAGYQRSERSHVPA